MFGLVSGKRYKELEKEYAELKTKIKTVKQSSTVNSGLRQEVAALQGQLADVKKQLREQTEADLFFISAKIQKKLLDGEPKENVQDLRLKQLAYQNMLAQQHMLAQQQINASPPRDDSFLSGLGLSNIFGRF